MSSQFKRNRRADACTRTDVAGALSETDCRAFAAPSCCRSFTSRRHTSASTRSTSMSNCRQSARHRTISRRLSTALIDRPLEQLDPVELGILLIGTYELRVAHRHSVQGRDQRMRQPRQAFRFGRRPQVHQCVSGRRSANRCGRLRYKQTPVDEFELIQPFFRSPGYSAGRRDRHRRRRCRACGPSPGSNRSQVIDTLVEGVHFPADIGCRRHRLPRRCRQSLRYRRDGRAPALDDAGAHVAGERRAVAGRFRERPVRGCG